MGYRPTRAWRAFGSRRRPGDPVQYLPLKSPNFRHRPGLQPGPFSEGIARQGECRATRQRDAHPLSCMPWETIMRTIAGDWLIVRKRLNVARIHKAAAPLALL